MINDIINGASNEELQKLKHIINNAQTNLDNDKINVCQFAEKIITKETITVNYTRFLNSKNVNAIMWAPTQVGKSSAICDVIKQCFTYNIPVIISTDNKTDQCEQLFSRVNKVFCTEQVMLLKVDDSKFINKLEDCIKSKNNKFIIFCLDNASQITKLIRGMQCAYHKKEFKELKKIAIIHDEADMITKDKDVLTINNEQAESHKKWIELIDFMNTTIHSISLKRIFVTATPENCCMLYDIENVDIFKLPIPDTYTGYEDIEYTSFEDNSEILPFMRNQVNRIYSGDTNEIILYCVDRKLEEDDVDNFRNCQNYVLQGFSEEFDCIVNTYNSNGINVMIKNRMKKKMFAFELKRQKIKYVNNDSLFIIKKLAIRKFYTICKSIDEKCVITIGKDLISRGISYVSEDIEKPLTATTIICKPGKDMHAVGISQNLGRVTGCASPELKRRVFAPSDVIKTYITYNKNQEKLIEKIQETKIGNTSTTIDQMNFNKYSRNIDRKKLQLKMNMVESENKSDTEYENEKIDGVDLNKLKKWLNDSTILGKMIRYLYDINKEISFEEFKDGINYTGSDQEFTNNIKSGCSNNSNYGKLWIYINNRIKINKKIKEFIDTCN